jgi:hypothetical protein
MAEGVHPQRKIYAYSLNFLTELRDFEWVLFVDSDEFLVLNEKYAYDIRNLIQTAQLKFPDKMPNAICFHWRWYGGKCLSYDDRILLQRFVHARSDPHVKSMVRIRDALSMYSLHFPMPKSRRYFVNSNLQEFSPFSADQHALIEYGGGHICHYWCRSLEEFAVKLLRGMKLAGVANAEYQRTFRQYFEWNVSISEKNFFPPDPEVIARLLRERQFLLSLPGVAAANAHVIRKFGAILKENRARFDLDRVYREE